MCSTWTKQVRLRVQVEPACRNRPGSRGGPLLAGKKATCRAGQPCQQLVDGFSSSYADDGVALIC